MKHAEQIDRHFEPQSTPTGLFAHLTEKQKRLALESDLDVNFGDESFRVRRPD